MKNQISFFDFIVIQLYILNSILYVYSGSVVSVGPQNFSVTLKIFVAVTYSAFATWSDMRMFSYFYCGSVFKKVVEGWMHSVIAICIDIFTFRFFKGIFESLIVVMYQVEVFNEI